MIKKQLFLTPDFIKDAKDFFEIKLHFRKWVEETNALRHCTLEEGLKTLKKNNISIPRIIAPNINHQLRFYRVRVINCDSGEDVSDPKTFSYPPKKYTSKFQRANAPYYPVFYGALDAKTAFEEVRLNGDRPIKRGDIAFLSEWTIKENIVYSLCYLTCKEVIFEQQLFSELTKSIFKDFDRIFKNEKSYFKKTQVYLFEKLSELFLTGTHFQSGTIAHNIIYDTPEINGIKIAGLLYPSCANNFRSINCAFHPMFVDDFLELKSVRKIAFTEFANDGVQFDGRYYGEVENNRIIWKNYISTVFENRYTIELSLNIDWPEYFVEKAECFLNDELFDLYKHCSKEIKKLDFANYKIDMAHEHYFKQGMELYYTIDINTENDNLYLKVNGNTNIINTIRIKVPITVSSQIVDCEEVLKYNFA